MKSSISATTLLLSIACLSSLATARSEYPYNRAITGVEVRPVQGQPVGVYQLIVAVQIQAGDALPSQGANLDLGADVQMFIDGAFWSSTRLDALVRSNGGPPCDVNSSSCDSTQQCGYNESAGFQMYCQTPPAGGDCYCTSDVFVDLDPFMPNTGGTITVTIGANAALPEVFLPDDSFSFEFLGASYCTSAVNSTGGSARISATGSQSVQANDLTLSASPLPANQFGIFYYGRNAIEMPFGEGYRCVGGQTSRLPITNSGPQGVLTRQLDLTSPPDQAGQITAGSTQHFQAWFRDPQGGPSGFNLSDGYMITFLP